ncbi:insulinase family protein [Actinoplanes sp. NPDC023801]|uniref:insulinase family protein n=1 Tax=Actinoplanes sp. NPDC023801 TaxID=3154595 RepID=UPI0033E6D9B6
MRRLEVDGIPAVLAPVSGPAHAGLVFRVGTADEPLARRGITRLAARLVTDGGGGSVGPEHTYFHVRGSAAEIVAYLAGVCEALRNPPMDRLAAVRDPARTERDPLPMWRHGARGPGVASYPEWGLPGLGDDELRKWIARYFTRENAALWLAGEEVPEGLALDLPTGERQSAPAVGTTLPVTPAWFAGAAADVVAWDTVVRRGPHAAVFANVLERRMLHEMSDVTRRVHTEYAIRSDGTARIVATADALPEKADAALGGLIDVLAGLRAGRVAPDEVAAVVKLTCAGLRESESRGARLPGQAFNLLAGREVQTLEEALAEVRAVTVTDVVVVAAEAYDAGLLMTPPGGTAGWAGYTAAPAMSPAVLPGRTHHGRGNRRLRLISGDDGVSVAGPDVVASVRWDSCAALLAWPDGARHLIGDDAVVARIEPTLFRGADRVVREADARVPQRLRIEMPPRDRDRIPRPEPARGSTGGWWPLVAAVVFGVLAAFFAGGGVWLLGQLLTGGGGPGSSTAENALVVASALLFGGFFGRLAVTRFRERFAR